MNEKVELLCKLASPVKWCLKEKVLLGKWSAIAMLELQCIRFAGWALTEEQHRPKAGKKKKTREVRCRFLAIVDVRAYDMYRDHAKHMHASPVASGV